MNFTSNSWFVFAHRADKTINKVDFVKFMRENFQTSLRRGVEIYDAMIHSKDVFIMELNELQQKHLIEMGLEIEHTSNSRFKILGEDKVTHSIEKCDSCDCMEDPQDVDGCDDCEGCDEEDLCATLEEFMHQCICADRMDLLEIAVSLRKRI